MHIIHYSHSVVPGGLDVRSYKTREIPGTVEISLTIFLITCETSRIESDNNEINYQALLMLLTIDMIEHSRALAVRFQE